MKLTFDNIFKILIVVALIGNFIAIVAKPNKGLTKEESKQLQEYYFKRAMTIGSKDKIEIISRLNQIDSLKAQVLESEKKQDARDQTLKDIDKKLKNIDYEININWNDSSGSSVKKFLSDRINIHKNR